ncbi:unnamed protein product [Spirodela intermedia]|uniref:Uncharacterized protein n=1 Tax=Spirodela intermedia TaxID=51605 RepID=A0A7I8J5R5_SPIIN|nr:unnamed protein product [Spirodela intermedia]CAA6665576.1 unnamed protein product [Spirodela intermedia]
MAVTAFGAAGEAVEDVTGGGGAVGEDELGEDGHGGGNIPAPARIEGGGRERVEREGERKREERKRER